MAERKITNNTMLLFLGELEDTLDTVVCLTKVADNFTVDSLDAATIQDKRKFPGVGFAGEITADAQHLLELSSGKISGFSLFFYMANRVVLFYKISPAVPVEGDIIQTGKCFITSLSDNYQYNTQSNFSVTLTIDGIPEQVEYVAEGRILDETGFYILAETGDFILTE